jgi:hypothetical protein
LQRNNCTGDPDGSIFSPSPRMASAIPTPLLYPCLSTLVVSNSSRTDNSCTFSIRQNAWHRVSIWNTYTEWANVTSDAYGSWLTCSCSVSPPAGVELWPTHKLVISSFNWSQIIIGEFFLPLSISYWLIVWEAQSVLGILRYSTPLHFSSNSLFHNPCSWMGVTLGLEEGLMHTLTFFGLYLSFFLLWLPSRSLESHPEILLS